MMRVSLLGTACALAAGAWGGGPRAAWAQAAPVAAAPVATSTVPLAAATDTGGLFTQPFTGGLLPNVGTDSRGGDLRPQLERYFQTFGGPSGTVPAWQIRPTIDVSTGVTDNALRVNSPRNADVFTTITPSVVVTGDTSRLKVNLAYSPTFTVYASQTSQTRTSQFGNGQALGIIVPDAVFVDVRGSISESSLTGNGLNGYGSNYDRQNQVTTETFSITPYVQHRFGGWGTVRLGYSFARTLQDVDNTTLANRNLGALSAFGTPGYGATGNLSTQRERVSFTSGENFGRFNDYAVAEAVQYSGAGSYRGAFRNQFFNEVGYALTRRITLLGGFGFQDIRYAGAPPVVIQEPTWNLGVRYSPNPDTTVTVLYGHHDGITSVSFDGSYAPTARTRLIGRYSVGITSDIEEAQNVLEATSVGANGLVTDAATGSPVSGGNFFGTQNGVYKVRRLSLTGLLLQDRNTYSAGVVYEERTTLTSTPTVFNTALVPAGTKSDSVYLNLSWQHDLAPDLSSQVGVQYGITDNTGSYLGTGGGGRSGSQRTLSLTASLNKQFTETLSGSIRYIFTNQDGGNATNSGLVNATAFGNTGSYTENILLVGLRKSF